jgi:hypothetical protein
MLQVQLLGSQGKSQEHSQEINALRLELAAAQEP